LLTALGDSLCTAGAFGVLYLALEPYVRRRWPHALIGWSRLLGDGLRDPLVAGHSLIGIAMALTSSLLWYAQNLLLEEPGSIQYGPITLSLNWLMDARHMVSKLAVEAPYATGTGLFFLF